MMILTVQHNQPICHAHASLTMHGHLFCGIIKSSWHLPFTPSKTFWPFPILMMITHFVMPISWQTYTLFLFISSGTSALFELVHCNVWTSPV